MLYNLVNILNLLGLGCPFPSLVGHSVYALDRRDDYAPLIRSTDLANVHPTVRSVIISRRVGVEDTALS